MKDGFVKIGAVSPLTRVGDVSGNCAACIKAAERAAEQGVKVLVFPELCLTGATLGDLFKQSRIHSAVERELDRFIEQTAHLEIVSFIGLPMCVGGAVFNAVAAVYGGGLLGIVAKSKLTAAEKRWFTPAHEGSDAVVYTGRETRIGAELLFSEDSAITDLVIGVAVGDEISAPVSVAQYHALAGATIVVNPAASPEAAGRADKTRTFMLSESRRMLAAVATANAGIGESGTDGVYSGCCGIYECGEVLAESLPFAEDNLVISEIDVEMLMSRRLCEVGFESNDGDYCYSCFSLDEEETALTRNIPTSPFIPEGEYEKKERLELLFDMQSRALAERIKRAHSKGVVIGVSGGLDSTLALLVSARAAELCGLDSHRVVAITMPCFGTTERTKGNAEKLSEALGADLRCIDIKAAVTQHFSDIGHNSDNYNVVYENAQARERTQILMDVANSEGALVVGTGDLSELALGFATYNGDHMSMYGVNASMPKTLMRHMVAHAADKYEAEGKPAVAGVLRDVLATPVSPELLPPKDGEIAQCTEGIVGPYELHDFFLYYLLRFGTAPEKISRMAKHAFCGVFDSDTVDGWLRIFLRRFFTQQFKRSCLPDGPALGSVTLSPRGGFVMPSDAAFDEWMR